MAKLLDILQRNIAKQSHIFVNVTFEIMLHHSFATLKEYRKKLWILVLHILKKIINIKCLCYMMRQMGFVHVTGSNYSEGVTIGRSLNLPHAGHDRASPRRHESGHDGASMVVGEGHVLGNFRQCYIRPTICYMSTYF
jgi:hypothetical protein